MKRYLILSVILLLLSGTALAKRTTGDIFGEVKLDGALPKQPAPSVVQYHGICGNKRSLHVIQLWKEKVKDVTFWLTQKNNNAAPLEKSKISYLVINKCDFHPVLVLAYPGSIVKITNEDFDTQWLLIDEEGFKKKQKTLEPAGTPIEIKVAEDRIIHLSSALYPWMETWIKPVDDLAFESISSWDGKFLFTNIPAGEYTLHAWHPVLGEVSSDVKVDADKKLNLIIKFPIPEVRPLPIIHASELENTGEGDGEEKEENPFKH